MTQDKRKYLKPETAAKLQNMALRARLVVEGYISGMHKSPYHGFSVEFAEHRAYGPGDEIRHIDWKLYGKTDRFYTKRYEEETNLHSHILLDISNSMHYSSGKLTKLEYGSYLTAALSYLMLNQQDGVGLGLFHHKLESLLPPRSTQSHLNSVFTQLENITPGQDTNLGSVLHEMAERIKKRGLTIIISDLMDDMDLIMDGLKHFRHKKQEMIVFHIIDREEIEFSFNTRTRFKDMETGEMITTEPWQIRNAYKSLMKTYQDRYRKQCGLRKIDYLPLYTDLDLDYALNEYLRKRIKLG